LRALAFSERTCGTRPNRFVLAAFCTLGKAVVLHLLSVGSGVIGYVPLQRELVPNFTLQRREKVAAATGVLLRENICQVELHSTDADFQQTSNFFIGHANTDHFENL